MVIWLFWGSLDDVNITPKSQYLHRVTYGLMQKYIRTHKEKKAQKMFFKRLFHKKSGWIHLTYNQSNKDNIFLLESLKQCKICFKGLASIMYITLHEM